MSRKSVHLALACALVILAGLAWTGLAVAQNTNGDLKSQIDALATRVGFTVNGLQRIGEASARPIT